MEATSVKEWVLIVVLVEERRRVRLQKNVLIADVVRRGLVGDNALTQIAKRRLLMRGVS